VLKSPKVWSNWFPEANTLTRACPAQRHLKLLTAFVDLSQELSKGNATWQHRSAALLVVKTRDDNQPSTCCERRSEG